MCLAPQKLVRTIFAWFFLSSPLRVVLFCLIGIICNVQTRSINQPFDWFVMIRICIWDIIIFYVVVTKTGKPFFGIYDESSFIESTHSLRTSCISNAVLIRSEKLSYGGVHCTVYISMSMSACFHGKRMCQTRLYKFSMK